MTISGLRGLCPQCYADPTVRESVRPVLESAPASRVVRKKWSAERPLPVPTAVTPGPDKVAVLAARYAAKKHLWHQQDAVILS